MKPLVQSIACILGLAAISAAPLSAQCAPHKDIVDTAVAADPDPLVTERLFGIP